MKERDLLRDLGENKMTILKWLLWKWGVDWVQKAGDRTSWPVFVTMVIHIWVQKMVVYF